MKRINSILVPTDFSAVAENALTYAINLAEKTNASIMILHTYSSIPVLADAEIGFAPPSLEMGLEKIAYNELRGLEISCPDLQHVKYDVSIIPGILEDVISAVVSDKEIDLMIMGTSGISGLLEILGRYKNCRSNWQHPYTRFGDSGKNSF